jgi:uncharacterized protein with FMN-binding domain
MSRNKIIPVAYSVITLASVVGGTVLTNHFAAASTVSLAPAPGGSSSGTPAPSSSATTPAATKKDMTTTGDPVPYQFGTIQLSVTRKSGKITDIGLVQAQASGGRDQVFPALVQAGLSSQGSGFGNYSGATYTTQAFKQALDSAISKLS